MPTLRTIDEQSFEKSCVFLTLFFFDFFCFFSIFCRFWEAPGPSKFQENRPRHPKNEFWGVSWTHLFSKVGLGRVLGRFWKGFGCMLEGILDLRTEMLTPIFLCGISSDQGDQEKVNEGVLIRYLGKWMPFRRSLGLALRGRVRCGELSVRWGVGVFFQARFQIRLFSISERFWEVLGGQSGGQNRFLRCFFRCFFRS